MQIMEPQTLPPDAARTSHASANRRCLVLCSFKNVTERDQCSDTVRRLWPDQAELYEVVAERPVQGETDTHVRPATITELEKLFGLSTAVATIASDVARGLSILLVAATRTTAHAIVAEVLRRPAVVRAEIHDLPSA
tara:strand:- start:1812 stop:2222 length:411 start_codon:yes stop_codon:yes gene_type:complete